MAEEKVLEVGVDPETNEVCVNVPVCEQKDGFWHLTFTAEQTRNFAELLLRKAIELENEETAPREGGPPRTPGNSRSNVDGHHLDCRCKGCYWKQRYSDVDEIRAYQDEEIRNLKGLCQH